MLHDPGMRSARPCAPAAEEQATVLSKGSCLAAAGEVSSRALTRLHLLVTEPPYLGGIVELRAVQSHALHWICEG